MPRNFRTIFAALLFCASAVYSQIDTGAIVGTVACGNSDQNQQSGADHANRLAGNGDGCARNALNEPSHMSVVYRSSVARPRNATLLCPSNRGFRSRTFR